MKHNKTLKNKTKSNILKHKTKSKTKKKHVFKKEDFYSGDGFLTSVWGPTQWHMLHTISFNYPINPTKTDKKYYKQYLLNLQYTLPCKYCRINLRNNLKTLPITNEVMENRENFSRYVYNLHELVNKMLDKKSNLTYCDVRERYEHFRARCIESPSNMLKHINTCKIQKKEKGCVEPLYGKKSRCILNIIPQDGRQKKSMLISDECMKIRGVDV